MQPRRDNPTFIAYRNPVTPSHMQRLYGTLLHDPDVAVAYPSYPATCHLSAATYLPCIRIDKPSG